MNDQAAIMMAMGVMWACGVAFVLMMPALVMALGRAGLAAVVRLSAVMAVPVAIMLGVAAALGSSSAAYSILS